MLSLKEDQIMKRIRWSVVEKVYGRAKINFCLLCLAEKVHLIEHFNGNRLLNKRKEFISGCRHQVKLLLKVLNGNKKRFNEMSLIVFYKTESSCL